MSANPHPRKRNTFDVQSSRRLDGLDAAIDEMSAAWNSLRRSNKYRPDLPIGPAFSAIINATAELKAERQQLLVEVGL